MTPLLLLTILVLLFAGILAAARSKGKRLLREGKMRIRDLQFVDRAEVFRLREIPYETVRDALLKADYGPARVRMEEPEGKEAIVYRTPAWRAILRLEAEVGYEYHYEFLFADWDTRRGLPARPDTMNIVLTAVEKTMEALDPECRMQVRQRTAREYERPSWL